MHTMMDLMQISFCPRESAIIAAAHTYYYTLRPINGVQVTRTSTSVGFQFVPPFAQAAGGVSYGGCSYCMNLGLILVWSPFLKGNEMMDGRLGRVLSHIA